MSESAAARVTTPWDIFLAFPADLFQREILARVVGDFVHQTPLTMLTTHAFFSRTRAVQFYLLRSVNKAAHSAFARLVPRGFISLADLLEHYTVFYKPAVARRLYSSPTAYFHKSWLKDAFTNNAEQFFFGAALGLPHAADTANGALALVIETYDKYFESSGINDRRPRFVGSRGFWRGIGASVLSARNIPPKELMRPVRFFLASIYHYIFKRRAPGDEGVGDLFGYRVENFFEIANDVTVALSDHCGGLADLFNMIYVCDKDIERVIGMLDAALNPAYIVAEGMQSLGMTTLLRLNAHYYGLAYILAPYRCYSAAMSPKVPAYLASLFATIPDDRSSVRQHYFACLFNGCLAPDTVEALAAAAPLALTHYVNATVAFGRMGRQFDSVALRSPLSALLWKELTARTADAVSVRARVVACAAWIIRAPGAWCMQYLKKNVNDNNLANAVMLAIFDADHDLFGAAIEAYIVRNNNARLIPRSVHVTGLRGVAAFFSRWPALRVASVNFKRVLSTYLPMFYPKTVAIADLMELLDEAEFRALYGADFWRWAVSVAPHHAVYYAPFLCACVQLRVEQLLAGASVDHVFDPLLLVTLTVHASTVPAAFSAFVAGTVRLPIASRAFLIVAALQHLSREVAPYPVPFQFDIWREMVNQYLDVEMGRYLLKTIDEVTNSLHAWPAQMIRLFHHLVGRMTYLRRTTGVLAPPDDDATNEFKKRFATLGWDADSSGEDSDDDDSDDSDDDDDDDPMLIDV